MRCIKNQLNAEIHFCTKKSYEIVLKSNPHITKLHLLENGLINLIKELKNEQFDYIIDIHNNLRTNIIKFAMFNVKSFTFDKINYEKFLAVKFKNINALPRKHLVDRYFEPLLKIGVKNDFVGLEYFIPDKDVVEMSWFPKEFQNGYVAFAIGAQQFTKRLPIQKIIEFCDRVNKPIILIGGKEDADAGAEVENFFKKTDNKIQETYLYKEMNKKTVVFNGCGKFNLNQSASIIKQSEFVLAHDTGMMHVAACFKKEIISFWGNTIPEFGMYPYLTKFTIIENKNLGCRPCSKIGFQSCPKGHFKCMNDLNWN